MSKMTVSEAGKRGIASSIERYGIDGHAKRCRMAVAAREFYRKHPKDGREKWMEMSEKQREAWCEKNVKND